MAAPAPAVMCCPSIVLTIRMPSSSRRIPPRLWDRFIPNHLPEEPAIGSVGVVAERSNRVRPPLDIYTYALTGVLPNGLTFSPAAPPPGPYTESGSFNFAISAKYVSTGTCAGSQNYTLVVWANTPAVRNASPHKARKPQGTFRFPAPMLAPSGAGFFLFGRRITVLSLRPCFFRPLSVITDQLHKKQFD